MIHLCEREIGFDPVAIGFPSIDGCRAVVIVTAGGLFGFHLNGSLNLAKRTAFVDFVTQHVHGMVIRHVYAASASVGAARTVDEQEIRDIATALAYAGPIHWAALPAGGSSYVHYQDSNHTTCSITSRTWVDANDAVPANRGPYAGGANRAIANGAAPGTMYIDVALAGLTARYPVAI